MAVKNIVFDFDGVIGDTFDIVFALSQAADQSMTHDDFVEHHDGNVYEEPKIKFSAEGAKQFYADYSNRISLSHIAEAVPSLERLANSYKLFIISSNEEYGIKAVLEKANIARHFDAIYGYNTHKSKITKFEMLRDQFGIDFDETVFITDTLGDIKEGNKVGVKVIAETFGFHSRERLAQGSPYKIVDSWKEIEQEITTLS